MAFIGLRCVDPAERKTLNDLNIPAFSMREIDEFGIIIYYKHFLMSTMNNKGTSALNYR